MLQGCIGRVYVCMYVCTYIFSQLPCGCCRCCSCVVSPLGRVRTVRQGKARQGRAGQGRTRQGSVCDGGRFFSFFAVRSITRCLVAACCVLGAACLRVSSNSRHAAALLLRDCHKATGNIAAPKQRRLRLITIEWPRLPCRAVVHCISASAPPPAL